MAPLKPTFSLSVGSLSSTSDRAVGGPTEFRVDRDMDVPADALEIRLMDRGDVSLGDDVTLDLGHDGTEARVFTGKVAFLRPEIDGARLRALGTMTGLLTLRASSYYEGQTAGSIADDLIGQAGLDSGTVDGGPKLPLFAVDIRESGFAHLKSLADRLGYELFADRDGAVHFRGLGPGAGLDGGLPGGGLSLGTARYEFAKHVLKARVLRRDPAWKSADVGGESPMSGEGDTAAHWLTPNDSDYRGSAGQGDPVLRVRDAVARTKDLADRFAEGRLAVAARTARQVWVTLLGTPGLDLGDPFSTGEFADELANGTGYVRALRHRFGAPWGFVTDVRVSMEADA